MTAGNKSIGISLNATVLNVALGFDGALFGRFLGQKKMTMRILLVQIRSVLYQVRVTATASSSHSHQTHWYLAEPRSRSLKSFWCY